MLRSQSADEAFRSFLQTRDPEALGVVFDQLAPGLLRYAFRLGAATAAAEDLVQATFLAVIEEDIEFHAHGSVDAFLRGILRNRAQRLHKASSRSPDPARLPVLKGIENPLDSTVRAELASEVREAVDGLPQTYRQVMDLHLRAGMQPSEIARYLGRRAGTVRMQLKRGLEWLKKRLPAGLGGGLVLGSEPCLIAIRERVMSRVGEHRPSALRPHGVSGGLAVTVLVLVTVGIAGLFATTWRFPDNETLPHAGLMPGDDRAMRSDQVQGSTITALPRFVADNAHFLATSGIRRQEITVPSAYGTQSIVAPAAPHEY